MKHWPANERAQFRDEEDEDRAENYWEPRHTYIIQHQLGLHQVIRLNLNSGDAFSFCARTAGMAIEAGYAW